MRKLAVAIALVFPLTMAAPAASATPTPALSSSVSATYSTVDSVVLSTFEANLVAGVNSARATAGLPVLRVAGGSTDIARRWAATLADAPTLQRNPDLGNLLAAIGSPNWRVAAENIAVGSDPVAIVAAYLSSPEHKANILDRRLGFVGVGATSNPSGRVTDVLDFVDSADAHPAATAPGYDSVTPPPPAPPIVSQPPAVDWLHLLIKYFFGLFGIVPPGSDQLRSVNAIAVGGRETLSLGAAVRAC